MKKFISQIMAAVLAFCMVAAIVPTVPAAAADGDIVLNFAIANVYESILDVDTETLGGWTWNQDETASYIKDNIISNTNGLKNWWAFREIDSAPGALQVAFYSKNINAQRMAFDFNVAEAGWYDLSDSSIMALVKANQITAQIDVISDGVASKAATIWLPTEGNEDSLAALKKFETEKVYLTKGTNTLVFRGTSMTSGQYDHTMLWVQKIVFAKTTAPSEVTKEDVVLDFTTKTFNALVDTASEIDYIVDYCGWNWKYNADLTSSGIKADIPHGSQNGNRNKLNTNMGCYYIKLNPELGSLVLNFYADNTGWYKINADGIVAGGVGADESGVTNVYAGSGSEPVRLAATVDVSGDTAVVTSENAVYLEKGDNILVLHGKSNGTYNNMVKLSSITFSPISDEDASAEATEPYAQTIEINKGIVGTEIATDAKYALHGWEVDKSKTSASMYSILESPTAANWKLQTDYMRAQFGWGENNTTLTYKFFNEVEGKYDISIVSYDLANEGFVGSVEIDGQSKDIDNAHTEGSEWVKKTKEIAKGVQLDKGANYITFNDADTGSYNHLSLGAIILTPYVEPDPVVITNAAIFGDVSAYITKTETGSFKFTALAAINDTAYTEVGFYIDEDKYAVEGGNVYKVVTVNGVETKVAEFFPTTTPTGASDPYIFFSSKEFAAKPGSVEFTPYAVPVNGVEITGHTYSVTLS